MQLPEKPLSGSWVTDAEALLELGAKSIDARTVQGLLDTIVGLQGATNKGLAEQVLLLDTEPIANAIFGDERSPMQWHEDVASDVLKVVAGQLTKESAGRMRVLPVNPHLLEEDEGFYHKGTGDE